MFDVLLSPEEKALRDKTRAFVKNEIDPQLLKDMDQDKVVFPYGFHQKVAQAGLYGIRFPKEYGGLGLGWTAEVAAIMEIGPLGMVLGCQYSMPSIVGEALNKFGTEAQKKKFLAPMLKGELVSAEALTEPRGGSDFFGATTVAKKDGNEWVLTGAKRFIVGAEGADFFLVYAKTAPENPPHESLSVFIVERDRGVKVEHIFGLMGTRGGGTGRIGFHELRVPKENMVGPENGGAIIFNQMMIPERMTSAAGCVGGAQATLDVAASYSMKRKAFGRPIRKFQAVNFMVADSITKLDAARGLAYAAARTVDAGLPHRRMVSEAKKFCTETAWEVVNNAMQIMGGIGYTDVYPIERALRDIRLSMIWTGTSEIMSSLIQHEYYQELGEIMKDRRDTEADALHGDLESEKVFE
ncbi:MAG TPA: acyl-CoA dehydrogenase family protein [bacterium]|nr:acyl-CoA dehydrogenase family protein [bacterium]